MQLTVQKPLGIFGNVCPKCKTKLSDETHVEHVSAFGEDPPYGGTYQIKTLTCPKCSYTFSKEPQLFPSF